MIEPMTLVVHAILFTVFAWWFTTGAIIYLDGLPQRTFPMSMLVATLGLAFALHQLALGGADVSVAGAYWAFSLALLAWGWNEMGFLMGLITGPRTTACPPEATGVVRLGYAIQVVLYHEAAIAATAVAIWAVTYGAPNQMGMATFALLWVMRLSAKINVYLGVPNITEEFLPAHLKYLKSYFRQRPMNGMFPVSIMGTTLLAAYFGQLASASAATPFEVTGAVLLATLTALALVEHWFMVLPIPSEALWKWGLTSHVANTELADQPRSVSVVTPTAASVAFQCLSAQHGTVVVPFPQLTPATHRRHT